MKAIILAAGEGIRLRPLTSNKPKPLVEVAGQPLLFHAIKSLPEEVDKFIVVIGYEGEQIKKFLGDNFLGRPITYVWQHERKGTYHALLLCRPLLEEHERFLILYADDLTDQLTIKWCLAHELAAATKIVPDPSRFGVVLLNDDGSIKEVIEKPEQPISNVILTNAIVLNTKIFKYDPSLVKNEFHISTVIAAMAKEYKIMAVPVNFWFPIATPEDVKKAEEILKDEHL